MDFLIELIGEILIEGVFFLATNQKISKWIRYPVLVLLILFYSIIIFGILFIGINNINVNFGLSLVLIIISVILLIGTVVAFYRKFNEEEK